MVWYGLKGWDGGMHVQVVGMFTGRAGSGSGVMLTGWERCGGY